MLEATILVIHLLIAVSIIGIILIQPSEAGGFMGGSQSNMMAPRRRADVLTRATTILGGIFFVTSLILAVLAGSRPAETSILDADVPAVSSEAAPAAEGAAPAEAPATTPAAPKAPEAPKAPISQ